MLDIMLRSVELKATLLLTIIERTVSCGKSSSPLKLNERSKFPLFSKWKIRICTWWKRACFLCCVVVSFELEAFHASCMPKIGVHVHKFYVNGRCNLMLTAVYIVAQSRLIQMSRFLAVFWCCRMTVVVTNEPKRQRQKKTTTKGLCKAQLELICLVKCITMA